MDAWIASAVSSLIVGTMIALFQMRLNKSVEDSKEASVLKFRNLTEKVEAIDEKQDSLSKKIDQANEKIYSVNLKMVEVIAEQKHTTQNLSELRDAFKQNTIDYGRIIKK